MSKHPLSPFLCPQEELVLALGEKPKRSYLNGLCCLTFGLVVFMAGLVMASIYAYRYYYVTQVSAPPGPPWPSAEGLALKLLEIDGLIE